MKKFSTYIEETKIDGAIEWHMFNNVPLIESIFRSHSDYYYAFYARAKQLYSEGALDDLSSFDRELMESDIGDFVEYEGDMVPLDCPFLDEEEEKQELNKPKRGGPKKFYVFVKDPKTGNIKKVSWGDTTGLSVKIDDPEARKSFAARHKCSIQNDKTTPAYWACRTPYYAKSLGLSGGGNFFW
jgi:hypothetical protein